MTFATWNPSDKGSGVTLSNGNLTGTGPEGNGTVRATFGKSAGKWYWEVTYSSGTYSPDIGIADASATLAHYNGFDSHGWGWFGNEGKKYTNGVGTALGTASTTGATIGVALDMDAGTCVLYKNGVLLGTLATGLTGTIYPACGGNATVSTSFTANFGASSFTYTAPAGFVGVTDASVAAGFRSTTFGTPRLTNVQTATGVSTTAFGTPFGVIDQLGNATGFSSTQMGLPRLVAVAGSASGIAPTIAFGLPVLIPTAVAIHSTTFGTARIYPMHAVGFSSTALGSPSARQFWRAHSLGPTTRFGTPGTPTDRANAASGFLATRFGTPGAIASSPGSLARKTFASALGPVARFGTPSAALAQTGQASGFTSTAFGTPRSAQAGHADAIGPLATFGTPTLSLAQRAAGFKETAFGTPTLRLTAYASSIAPRTRFGTPRQWAAHQSYGFCNTRFGHPRGLNQHRYHTTGFCGTAFGTPAMHETHRAVMTSPGSRFGTPLLRRNPQCPFLIVGRAASIGPTSTFGTPTWSH
jgi:hypothetical protein